jgi:hypothetical protein
MLLDAGRAATGVLVSWALGCLAQMRACSAVPRYNSPNMVPMVYPNTSFVIIRGDAAIDHQYLIPNTWSDRWSPHGGVLVYFLFFSLFLLFVSHVDLYRTHGLPVRLVAWARRRSRSLVSLIT